MQKKLPLYFAGLCMLLLSFLFFKKAYTAIINYTALTERANAVYSNFQNLSKQVKNAAVMNADLKSLEKDGVQLFFTDSLTIIRQLQNLKLVVKDSVNIGITQQVEQLLNQEISWLISSNVPDSIVRPTSHQHIASLQKIDSLINSGIRRTDFLLVFHKQQLTKAFENAKAWMIVFIAVTCLLLFYTTFNFLKQQSKTQLKETELEVSNRLLKTAQHISQTGNWVYNRHTGNLFWSEEMFAIYGIPQNSQISYQLFLNCVQPEDRITVAQQLEDALSGGKDVDIEYRISCNGDEDRWIHQKGQMSTTLPSGTFEGTVQDITVKKKAAMILEAAVRQQSLLSSIVNSSDDAIISKTLDGMITSWNHSAEKMFGYSAAEMTGQSIQKIIPPELMDEEMDIILKIQKGEFIRHYETERIKKDGTRINVSVTISPVFDSNHKVTGASKIARDITEKKKAAALLLAINEEKNIILESIDDAFFSVDKNWIVKYWNSRAEKMLNKPRHQIIGFGLWEIYANSINSIPYKKYHEAIEKNEVLHFEHFNDQQDRWFEISAYPSPNGLSVYFKDITERKLSEINLNELNKALKIQTKELARSNEELEQFAYVASHDLQEPLRMIISFLSLFEKKYGEGIDETGKQFIAFVVDGAQRMRQVILDLLEFSRAGRVEKIVDMVNLNELIENIKLLYKTKLDEERGVIRTEKLPVIYSFKVPLMQIFQNLIGNGLKYIRPGTPPEIHIDCTELSNYWQISVADNGIGIGKEYHEKIFVLFQRLHTREQYAGTGMGLSITKKIVENLGGKIWVTSEEDSGSTFYFTIEKTKPA